MLFRLPECYLQCSAFFRERLNAEQVPNEPPHLLLENVTVAEFRSLLNVMTRSASEYVSHGITTTAAGLIVVFVFAFALTAVVMRCCGPTVYRVPASTRTTLLY